MATPSPKRLSEPSQGYPPSWRYSLHNNLMAIHFLYVIRAFRGLRVLLQAFSILFRGLARSPRLHMFPEWKLEFTGLIG